MLLLAFSAALNAQKKYIVGTAVDVVGGGDDNPQFSGLRVQSSGPMEPFYGVFPSVTLELLGARSSLNVGYAYGWQRTESTRNIQSESHAASLTLTNRFSPKWSTSIRESFSVSDDAQTFYALRGVLPTPEGLTYVFSPVAVDQTARSNTVNIAVDHSFNAKSALAFSGSHSLRNYGSDGFAGLTNQQDVGAGATYTRRTSERTSWNFGYSWSYYRFAEFSNAISNAVRIGMSNQFARNTSFSWSAGVSQVKSRQSSSSFAGFEASAGLQHAIRSNVFQADLGQSNSPSGLGSVSKNRRASLGFNRPFGRIVSLFASASVFDGKAILDNTFDTRGGSATANIGFALTRNLSLQVGGQYQRYTKPVTYEFTQRRLFVSLRYSHPSLLHSH